MVHRGGDRESHQPVEDSCSRRRRHSVAVKRDDPPVTHRELELVGGKAHAQLLGPEGAAPTVVVPADQRDRYTCRESPQRRGDPKSFARNDAAVGEPELEQIAIDQERVAEVGHRVEELEERGFGLYTGLS